MTSSISTLFKFHLGNSKAAQNTLKAAVQVGLWVFVFVFFSIKAFLFAFLILSEGFKALPCTACLSLSASYEGLRHCPLVIKHHTTQFCLAAHSAEKF